MLPEYLRYSCQVALPGFGEATQQQLKAASVLIVGVGGLGCPAAQYLTSAGIGTIGIADFDVVSISNLHRQILYNEEDVGQKKVDVACKKLQKQNLHIRLIPHHVKISSENVMGIIEQYDIIVDGTDNFDAKYLLNDACVLSGKPLVYGAIYQYEGQVAIWNVLNEEGSNSPNYRDLFPEVDAMQIPNCAEGGVIPTLAGVIGCMQANEVIKLITNTDDLLAGKILIFDAQTMHSRIIKLGTATKTNITGFTITVSVPTISVTALKQNKEEYELVDVRTTQERNIFNIGGRHIPLTEIDFNSFNLQTAKPVVLYCTSGKRSAEAVKKIIQKQPAVNVFSLEGGLKAWQEAG